MCRSRTDGGRRCMCSDDAAAAHNARRRRNHQVRGAITRWAAALGEPPAVIDALREQPPSVAKQWAAGAGLDPQDLRHDHSPHPGDRWGDVQVLEQVAAASRLQGDHPAEKQLLDGEVVYTQVPSDLGVNDSVRRVELDNGEEGFHKPFMHQAVSVAEFYGQPVPQQPLHEVAAWRLARAMGPQYERLLAPTVLRSIQGVLGSFSLMAAGSAGSHPRLDPAAWHHGAFFDAVTGQQDRHGMNLLHDPHGRRTTLIDHGFAFGTRGDPLNSADLVKQRLSAPRGDTISLHERGVLARLLASPDLLGIRPVIGDQRADAVLDRAQWMRRTNRLLDLDRYFDDGL